MILAGLDLVSGLSGDMMLGALVDAGAPLEAIAAALAPLGIPHLEIRARRVLKMSLAATKVDVLVDGRMEPHSDSHHHGHSHHHHSHDHHHTQHHHHDSPLIGKVRGLEPGEDRPHQGRHYRDIRHQIESAALDPLDRQRALAVFERLAEAEGRVHGIVPEEIHFHEVGAADALADIVGACAGLRLLGIEKLYCGPIPLGRGGMIRSAHGWLPAPAPATLELLKGRPTRSSPVESETVTPTGAALIAALCEPGTPEGEYVIDRTGYGAGAKDFDEWDVPNVARLWVARTLG